MSGRSKLVWTVVVLAVAGGIGFYKYREGKKAPGPRFEIATVDRGRIVAKVTATGTLSALVTVQVGSQVSGRIQKLFVDFNSPVKKGQPIAKIDPQLFEAALEQARANHAAAQGEAERVRVEAVQADRQYQRSKNLAERGLIAQADLDMAQAGADAARAQVAASAGRVQQTKAALHQASVNLAYTNIVSPINGIVISRSVDVGQTVAASLQAPTLFIIAEDLSKMQVNTSVAEADVGKLEPGMTATFTVDAFPSERFTGTVRQIRNAAQTVQNVVTYDAVIDVPNPEQKLRPGMTANVSFVYADRDDVVRVPNAALRFRPPPEMLSRGGAGTAQAADGSGGGRRRRNSGPEAGGVAAPSAPGAGPAAAGPAGGRSGGGRGGVDREGRKTVWVLAPAATEPTPVSIKIGVSDGTVTELLSGDLKEGQVVVTDVIAGPRTGGPGRLPGVSPGGGGMRRMF